MLATKEESRLPLGKSAFFFLRPKGNAPAPAVTSQESGAGRNAESPPFLFPMTFATIVAIALGLYAALAWYVFRRASETWKLGVRGKVVLGGLMAVGAVGFFGPRLSDTIAHIFRGELSFIAATSLAVTTGIAAIALAHVDGLRLLRALWRKLRKPGRTGADASGQLPEAVDSPMPETAAAVVNEAAEATPPIVGAPMPRRDFLQGATSAALVVAGGAGPYATLFGRHDYQIEEMPIALPGLSRRLDGYTIVQLSDVHVGAFVGDAELRSALALVRQCNPDLVVLTGDLIDHSVSEIPRLGRFVSQLQGLSRDGVAAVLGNHDHSNGPMVQEGLQRAGARVLTNRHMTLEGLTLVGVDDPVGRYVGWGPDLQAALDGAPSDVPRILLAHRPRFIDESHPDVQLQLSGHTHGGQLTFGYNPADLIMPYVRGHYRVGESQLYVNRGFGTAIAPARLGSPPEVTKIVLTS